MSNIILLFLCMLIGIALRRYGRVPDNAHTAINGFIINVSLPALTLLQIHGIKLQSTLGYAVAMPWLLFTIAALFFWSVSKLLQFTPATTGGLILVAGLGNTSFVGLPMIEAFYGPNGMPIGILIDQLGTYLVLSTLGIAVAALFSSESASGSGILKRICTFPPFIALFASLLLIPVDYPDWLVAVLRRLGDTLAPLALVSVGLQLRLDQLSGIKVPLSIGIAFKLLVGPAKKLLGRMGLDFEEQRNLTYDYFGDEGAKAMVCGYLAYFGLDESAIEAEAIKQVWPDLESIDRRLTELASSRDVLLRRVAEYRATLAEKLRESADNLTETLDVPRLVSRSSKTSA